MGSKGSNGILVYIAAIVSITLWGFSYIWNNELISLGVPIFYFVFIRVLIAGVILLLFNLLTGKFKPIRKEHLLLFLLLSVCEPFVYFIAETYGIKETGSPTISSMIIASVPVFSMVAGAVVFNEKVTFLNILGLVVTLGGLAMVLFSKVDEGVGQHFALGIVLLVVAVLIEVVYASLTKRLASDYPPQVIVMYQFLIGAVYFLPVFLTEGLENYEPLFLSWQVQKPILCLAILCSSLAFSLWAFSIKNLGVARSSVFLAMISVVTAFGSVTLGQEQLCTMQWVGIAVSVVGITVSQHVGRDVRIS
ncbi:MAG: DMT family transporter [Bacteroidales bacterium]|nr:DMT family transporter [Bacteroidales bacterium]